jgi:hypothetical protein
MLNIFRTLFKYIIQLNIIGSHIWCNVIKFIPSHIKKIKVIDLTNNDIYIYKSSIHNLINYDYLLNNNILTDNTLNDKFYIFTAWDQKQLSHKHYIIGDKLMVKITKSLKRNNNIITEKAFINKLYLYHKKYIDHNIFSIIISDKDVTHIFDKYKLSIAIPNNITVDALYLYYCIVNNINFSINNINLTCVDYNLEEKKYNTNDYIISNE